MEARSATTSPASRPNAGAPAPARPAMSMWRRIGKNRPATLPDGGRYARFCRRRPTEFAPVVPDENDRGARRARGSGAGAAGLRGTLPTLRWLTTSRPTRSLSGRPDRAVRGVRARPARHEGVSRRHPGEGRRPMRELYPEKPITTFRPCHTSPVKASPTRDGADQAVRSDLSLAGDGGNDRAHWRSPVPASRPTPERFETKVAVIGAGDGSSSPSGRHPRYRGL